MSDKPQRQCSSTRVALVLMGALLLGATAAHGGEDPDVAARKAYAIGKSAFERQDFKTAYSQFMKAYRLSQRPALLFNMSSALRGLDRPHDAAEALRSYLRLAPTDPDRSAIERRIAALEEEQHMLDLDHTRRPPLAPAPVAGPTLVASSPETVTASPDRTWLWVTLGVSAAVVAIVGLVAGVALSQSDSAPASRLGTLQVSFH